MVAGRNDPDTGERTQAAPRPGEIDRQATAHAYLLRLRGPDRGRAQFDLGIAQRETMERFRAKARAFLRARGPHGDPPTPNEQATYSERPGRAGKDAGRERYRGLGQSRAAKTESQGLGLFVRSLVGLDRGAAKGAFAEFLAGRTLSANQIEFIDLIINHLTEHGVMGAAALTSPRSRTSRRLDRMISSPQTRSTS